MFERSEASHGSMLGPFRVGAMLAALVTAHGEGHAQCPPTQLTELDAGPPTLQSEFGRAMSGLGTTLVVGSPDASLNFAALESGQVQTFELVGTSYVEVDELLAPTPTTRLRFGSSVALDGTRMLVGATRETFVLANQTPGTAFVYVRQGNGWQLEQQLDPSDGLPQDLFGAAVALSGDTAVVGAPFWSQPTAFSGAVYVFTRTGSTWTEQAKLTHTTGSTRFGSAVSLDGDVLAVGIPFVDAVSIFGRVGSAWSLTDSLQPENQEGFGTSLHLVGDQLVTGAPEGSGGINPSPAVFVHTKNAGVWEQTGRLKGFSGPSELGSSVFQTGNLIVAGASQEVSAYVFEQVEDSWQIAIRVAPSSGGPADDFGAHVVMLDDTIFVAAPGADQAGLQDAGVVHRFRSHADGPTEYCTAGTSSGGCQAVLSAQGVASANSPSGFVLTATGVQGASSGLFFYGVNGRQQVPWGNGTSFQCVKPPVLRLGLSTATGTPGSCDGTFALDLNATWCSTCPAANKNPGELSVVQAQFWYRDPLNTSNQTTSLSSALEFCVSP